MKRALGARRTWLGATVALAVLGASLAVVLSAPWTTGGAPALCTDEVAGGTAVAANAELLADCELLLQFRDALAGTGSLNWDQATIIESWDGVSIGGEPSRVTKLELAQQSLTGALPWRFVDLEALVELRVNGNSLSGRIPSELGQLRHLTHVYVSGNSFTGCYPPPWDELANHDLIQLGLPSCAIAYDLHASNGATEAGSYAFLSDQNDLHSTRADWLNYDSFALLLHTSDADGTVQAGFYDTIQVGDQLDWSRGPECYMRFAVTELLTAPAGAPARELFKVELQGFSLGVCDLPHLVDADQPVEFVWYPVPWVWGPDGIRQLVGGQPVTGPGRYRLGAGSEVVVWIPDGMTVKLQGGGYSAGHWHDALVDVDSGAMIGFVSDTGEVSGRWYVPEPTAGTASGTGEPARDVGALFDEIEASVETPGWGD